MRLIVFFDLPMLTDHDRREYSVFHKYLVRNGFIMMQKSVYSKLVINNVSSKSVKEKLKNNLPEKGIVELLEITENQFSGIEYLVGKEQQNVVDSLDRLIEV